MKKNHGALRWILHNSRPQLFNIILLALTYGLNAFIGVYNTVFARDLVNAAVAGDNIDRVYLYGGLFLGITVVQIVTFVLARHFAFKISTKMEISLKANLFRNIMDKDYAAVTAYHTGELMNRLDSDVSVVAGSVTSIIPSIAFFVVKIIGVFYILLTIDVLFALIFVIGGLVVFSVSLLFKPFTKRMHKQAQASDGRVRSFMQEGLSSLLMIKTFDAQEKMSGTVGQLQAENYRIKRKRNFVSILSGTAMNTVFSFAVVWAMCWGGYMLYYHLISYGVLMQIVNLVGQIRLPIQGMANIFPTYFTALASAERIMEIETLPDEEANHADVDIAALYERMDAIRFDDITFAYDSESVLEHASLCIKKGDFVAIEGISGIGKSTLFKLLMSVYHPSGGAITVTTRDESYAVDKSLRKLFSYVPQGNFLLSGTLRENIAFVAPHASEEDIMEAVRVACADDFIGELPNGLDSVIAERGAGLSEGQVQRVAIARALLTDSPVLLLDEATSALDEATEERLLTNLRGLNNITCIIISHKKAAERICDRIVTINDKKIVER